MPLKDKTYRLFEYISHVYSIDLPVDRDVTSYGAELWWQADITPSSQCKIKEFNSESNAADQNDQKETAEEDSWLSVIKRNCDTPPDLPFILKDWIELSPNPTITPTPKPSIIKSVSFENDKKRVAAFKNYVELMKQFLSDIPFAEITFTLKNSLYDIIQIIPGMNRTLLTEHFRCVPEIIEFNNHLCPSYGGRLEPLRQPNPQETLEPSIKTIFLKNGFKNDNDINEPEAELLVEMLVKCCQDEKYSSGGKNNRKRTMGVISLLGEKQAKYISGLIAQRIDETEREERRIICGDAYAFQGDERDIMFLSLVIAQNAPFATFVKESDRQRFNVAISRARDQVFLFHSVRLEDIKNPECMRYKLLSWYLNPPIAEMEAGIELLKQKAESEFEIEVGERIIKKGFKVIPQYCLFPSDFNYRIDLVIQGDKNRVAVECDGDRWHGIEKWEYDQRREAQLRRAGWKFWRISGSAFYRNKEKALEDLWKFLDAEGIKRLL